MSYGDVLDRLNKAIQESVEPLHRSAMMEAREEIKALREIQTDSSRVTLTRTRFQELLEMEQKLEQAMYKMKMMKLRH